MIFEILVAVNNETAVYWDLMSDSPVDGEQRYGGA
jgi:hypothetical protein